MSFFPTIRKSALTTLLVSITIFASSRSEISEANKIYAQGEYSQATDKYKKIIEQFPECQEAKYNLGLSQIKAGNTEDGIVTLRELTAETNNETLLKKARHILAYEQLEKAIEGLDGQPQLPPDEIKKRKELLDRSSELLRNLPQDTNQAKSLELAKRYSKILDEIEQQQQQNDESNKDQNQEDNTDKQKDQQNSQDQQSENQESKDQEQSDSNQQDGEENKDSQEQQDNQQDNEDESEMENSEQSEQQDEQSKNEMNQEEQKQAQATAQEILDKEKDAKKMRMKIIQQQTKVEKDW